MYPDALRPDATETFLLPRSGRREEISKATPTFVEWNDPARPVKKTYGGKAVLDLDGEPYFAELAVRKLFVDAGWDGVWVDKSKYRVGYDYFDEGKPGDFFVTLPEDKSRLLNEIYDASGTPHSGCWDVFCWKGDDVAFIESKRKDNVRPSQDLWLEAALQVGVPRSSFLVVKWSLAPARTTPGTSSAHPPESSGRAMLEVREILSDAEVASTYPVMRQLRPHVEEGEYVGRIGRMREYGYRLAAVVDDERVLCVARGSGSWSSWPMAGSSTWTISSPTGRHAPGAAASGCSTGSPPRRERTVAGSCSWIPACSVTTRTGSTSGRG